jgi:hypothetical protein
MNVLDSPLFLLGFLSLFHIIGGIVIGSTLKKMRQAGLAGVANGGCLLIWGIMFGGIPLAFGATELARSGIMWLLPTQLLILFGSIVITFLFGASLSDLLNQGSIKYMVGGGFFVVSGALAATILGREAEWWMSALFCILFCGVGIAMFIRGLRLALRELAAQEYVERE